MGWLGGRITLKKSDFDKLVPVIDYENLSIKGKAFYDAREDARKWILYPPAAFSIFAYSLYDGTLGDSDAAILGISAASLTIPYLLSRELTLEKTENFNSKDKQLYEKVYFEEYKKENVNILLFSLE